MMVPACLFLTMFAVSCAVVIPEVNVGALDPSRGFKILGVSSGDSTGRSASNAGDVNNDGMTDLIIGAVAANVLTLTGAGIAYVVFGRRTNDAILSDIDLSTFTTSSQKGFRILGSVAAGNLGHTVASVGDVNGDGIGDIMVGGYSATILVGTTRTGSGYACVIFGRDIPGGAPNFTDVDLGAFTSSMLLGFRVFGAASGDYAGVSVTTAGDVNGDGVGDIILGAFGANSQAGRAYVIFGRNITGTVPPFGDIDLLSFSSTAGFQILGAGGIAGLCVSGAGDINGDGVSDILVGARDASPVLGTVRSLAGITYVIFGRNTASGGPFSTITLATFAPSQDTGFLLAGAGGSDGSGLSVSAAGDVNGDGVSDIVVGAPGADTLGWANSGTVYVIFGRKVTNSAMAFTSIDLNAFSTAHGFRVYGAPSGASLGFSVSEAGDVNADGIDDIIIGTDKPTTGTGTAFLVYGRNGAVLSDINLSTWSAANAQGFRVVGGAIGNKLGMSVSTAGDLNQDGVTDVVVGAPAYGTGVAYVIFGVCDTPTGQPSTQPSSQPSRQPSVQPSTHPSRQPSAQPSAQPTSQPSTRPTAQPTMRPSVQPSTQPSHHPSAQPTRQPSRQPTSVPSGQPSSQPSRKPSCQPSSWPSQQPVAVPTAQPSPQPSTQPRTQPSSRPTDEPTVQPSSQPSTQPSCVPSVQPSSQPSTQSSSQPTTQPTTRPSIQPTSQPTVEPSSQPSADPTVQPSVQPSIQPRAVPTSIPSGLPTGKPSSVPSCCPTSQPSTGPTSQPSLQPTSQPSVSPSQSPTRQPTVQPTSQPSYEPSTQPTQQPTAVPSTSPSSAPSVQPSAQPSAQPSSEPSAQPSSRPSLSPSAVPTAHPSSPPTTKPWSQPTSMPSAQPSAHPSAAPTTQPFASPSGRPSSVPTARPTATSTVQRFVQTKSALMLLHCGSALCICGAEEGVVSCAVVGGNETVEYQFDWTRVSFMYITPDKKVILSAEVASSTSRTDEVSLCTPRRLQLECSASSLRDSTVLAASYVAYPNKVVLVGRYTVLPSISILDRESNTFQSYLYSVTNTKDLTLRHVLSPPYFAGSFVAGTAVRATATPVNYIVAGMVRTEGGILKAMVLMPQNGDIVNNADLVTTMALENTGPDSFIAGGLQVSDVLNGKHAYLLRANALFMSVQYCVRYVTREGGARRALQSASESESVVRGIILVDTTIFLTVDRTVSNITSLAALKVNSVTGAINQQVHVTARNASLSCADIVLANELLHVLCTVSDNSSYLYSVLLTVDQELTFTALPSDFTRSDDEILQAQNVPFKRTILTVTKTDTTVATTQYAFITAGAAPTRQPSSAPSMQPSSQPSSAPSAQPSSSPTAAPTVTARPHQPAELCGAHQHTQAKRGSDNCVNRNTYCTTDRAAVITTKPEAVRDTHVTAKCLAFSETDSVTDYAAI